VPTVLEALSLGLEHQRAGRLPEAEGVYRAVLTANPDNADALHLLGVIACQTGKAEAGVALVQQAIRLRPTVAQFHNTLGNALTSLRRLEEARFAFEWALNLDAGFAEALVNLGNLLQELNQPEDAVARYRRALELRPDLPQIHNNLGNALRRMGQLEDAISFFRQALRLNQEYAEAYVNLAAAALAAGLQDEAVHCCQQAIRLNPLLPAAHSNFAAVLLAQGRFETAASASREALRLAPDYPEAHHNLGDALRARGVLDEAIDEYREALRLQPDSPDTMRNLAAALQQAGRNDEAAALYASAVARWPDGESRRQLAIVLSKLGRFTDAEACCCEVLAKDPCDAEIHRILGNVYFRQRRLDEAASCYDAALALRPDDAGTHYNRALLLLLRGQFDEGWREYEWRSRRSDARATPFLLPVWQGEPLAGRRILVCAEQGLGDSIQFLRYLPKLEQAGGRVVFQCPSPLAPWLAKQRELGEVVDFTAAAPEADLQAPLLSLPRIFRTALETIPSCTPYLSVDPRLVEAWREKLAAVPGFRAGLVWAGSPQNSEDAHRSIPNTALHSLCDVPGVNIVCLQQDVKGGELPIHYLGSWTDIEDFAAIMMNLDLIISADTMAAHLAGALGRPVWTLLRFAADYRWLLNREDSPWYPTMRLFRQPAPGDWDAVARAVADELETYAGRR